MISIKRILWSLDRKMATLENKGLEETWNFVPDVRERHLTNRKSIIRQNLILCNHRSEKKAFAVFFSLVSIVGSNFPTSICISSSLESLPRSSKKNDTFQNLTELS